MRIAGVIAEYNPFHRGHADHLARTRVLTGCDFVIVCMAGSYTQRGVAACLDKWTRAGMALRCGADAVFELPALFTVRTADAFARGGVTILSELGADVLSFGCETDDLALLRRLAELREAEPRALAEGVRTGLDAGMSHARAWGDAAAALLGVDAARLNAPNMILGAEYLRAMRSLDSRMEALPILREGDYHDATLEGGRFASATAIRAAMAEGRVEAALKFVPEAAAEALRTAGRMHPPDDLLLARLRAMTEEEIAALPGVGEGLERRVRRCASEAATCEALIDALKCKRYTRARLTRLTAHALLGMTEAMVLSHPVPTYARLIGLREDAVGLMKELKRRSRIPIFSDPMKWADDPIFQLECRATDLRALQCDDPDARRAGQEWTRKFVRI